MPNPQRVRMGGFQMLLAGDILRAKFRNSLSTPEPMVPGEVTTVDVPDRRQVTTRSGRATA